MSARPAAPRRPRWARRLATAWRAIERGRCGEAARRITRVLREMEEAGAGAADRARALNYLGTAWTGLQRLGEAEACHLRAARALEEARAPNPLSVQLSFSLLASFYEAFDRRGAAEAARRREIRLLERTQGRASVEAAIARFRLADTLRAAGRDEDARAAAGRADAILRRAGGDWDWRRRPRTLAQVAGKLWGYGEFFLEEGKFDEAEACYGKLLGFLERALPSVALLTEDCEARGAAETLFSRILSGYARILRHRRRNADALSLEGIAMSIREFGFPVPGGRGGSAGG